MLAERDRHVPRVYGFGEKHGVFFIEMEFIDGEDLSAMLERNGTLGPREAARIAYEVASFLQVAHASTYGHFHLRPARLVHADLKPSNIRIARSTGEVKILDFGIARAGWQTQTLKQFGSVPYMSPERLEGRIDHHADCWALGVLLYEMLAGRHPFRVPGGPSQARELERLIVSRQPAPPLPSAIPLALQAIAEKMLRSDLAQRYQSAAEIKGELEAFLSGGSAAVTRAARRAYDGNTIVVTRRAHAPPAVHHIPRMPRGIATRLVIAAALVLAVDAYAVSRASSHLQEELNGRRAVDADSAWTRYERIERWALVPIGRSMLRASVKQKLIAAADRVLADFRRDQPLVRAGNWQSARSSLNKALALGADSATRARLLCAEGHLLRIDGHLREAVERFQQAARLDDRSPDPYLGLARIYSTGLVDVDRLDDALTAAARRGQPLGRRGHAQMADAIRARADRLRQSAASARGQPDETSYLRTAVTQYERALAQYEQAIGFAAANDNARQVRSRLAQVRARLAELVPPHMTTESK
ncbi:MAG TPA: protein kinase [Vicinamibacterales bacterium]